jgi:hypothetical protein
MRLESCGNAENLWTYRSLNYTVVIQKAKLYSVQIRSHEVGMRGECQQQCEHCAMPWCRCNAWYLTEFGVAGASQPNISRWETGAIKRPSSVSELLAYCDAYGPGVSSAASVRNEPGVRDAFPPGFRPSFPGDEIDEFDRLAGQVAGEPFLGAVQLELIRGMSRRLASGPPLSPEDRATYLDQLRILRLSGS